MMLKSRIFRTSPSRF